MLLRSLREGIDYSTPTGRMLAGIFAALAGYERELMLNGPRPPATPPGSAAATPADRPNSPKAQAQRRAARPRRVDL